MKSCVVLLLLALASIASAQIQHALEFDCYQPDLGNRSEADTICGRFDPVNRSGGESIGFDLKNIGPSPGSSYGTIVSTDSLLTLSIDSRPPLNLKSRETGRRVSLPLLGHIVHVGPVHTSTSRDLVVASSVGVRIYWSDADGNYDSTRFTDLVLNKSKYIGERASLPIVVAFLSSDTTEDVLFGFDSLSQETRETFE